MLTVYKTFRTRNNIRFGELQFPIYNIQFGDISVRVKQSLKRVVTKDVRVFSYEIKQNNVKRARL